MVYVPFPDALARSPLMARGGFGIYEGVADRATLGRLRSEAAASVRSLLRTDVAEGDGEEVRGGSPRRRFFSASGGPSQTAFYLSNELQSFVAGETALPIRPTGAGATFSYYVDPGDFLDIHRDIYTCDVAVITCLADSAPDSDSGALRVYPSRVREPLSSIRASADDGAFTFRLQSGQTIVLYGGIVPHAVLPVAAGQRRVVSVMCYEAVVGMG